MRITYANKRVKECFEDYRVMQRKIPFEWVRAIKKHIDRLKVVENFGDFMKLGLGHLEQLKGNNRGKFSVRINGNARLIIKPDPEGDEVMICEVVEVEGVVDYHGSKESWYIS